MSSPVPSRSKRPMSPTFEPESPLSRTAAKRRKKPPTTANDETAPPHQPSPIAKISWRSPPQHPSARIGVSPKRKRSSFEEHPISPEQRRGTVNSKRPRYSSTQEQDVEIPSTPERQPSPILGGSDTRRDRSNRTIHREEPEDADSDLLGMPASQSFSEPDRCGQNTHSRRSKSGNFDASAPASGRKHKNADEESSPEPYEVPPRVSSSKHSRRHPAITHATRDIVHDDDDDDSASRKHSTSARKRGWIDDVSDTDASDPRFSPEISETVPQPPMDSQSSHTPLPNSPLFVPMIDPNDDDDNDDIDDDDAWETTSETTSTSSRTNPNLIPNSNPNQYTHSPPTQTQTPIIPDFSIPSPPGGWAAIEDPHPHPHPTNAPTTHPHPDTTTTPTTTTTATDIDINTWVTTHQARGHSASALRLALLSTNMDARLAEVVLEAPSMRAGRGVPDDVPGVWTAADDADLQGRHARRVARVEAKHGGEGVRVRWEFLEELRREGEGEGEEG